jgi:4-hydroxythreonine-4-phosphate dehydrogenase
VRRTRVALTPGDPHGIGAEVGILAWAACREEADLFLLGEAPLWERAALLRGIPRPAGGFPVVEPSQSLRGRHVLPEIAAVAEAVAGCQDGRWDAVATGPIHKKRAQDAGFGHAGHTEFLSALCGLPPEQARMVFLGGRLVVALATVHLPLRLVPLHLDGPTVLHTIRVLDAILRGPLGLAHPRIACCGLNPHAGEEGMLGDEEGRVIAPAITEARASGIDVEGPLPGDSVFHRAILGRWDGVVALYHDQGLIPVKLLDSGQSVNVTAGLPIVRTSVDHGTARDIAWRGEARPESMIAAVRWAARLGAPRRT